MESYQREFIELALKYSALRFGEFTLKSGRISPYFFNIGLLNDGAALAGLGLCYAAALQHSAIACDVLFGPAYKGIPLVCAASIALSTRFQRNIDFCFNRKEKKDHGEGGQLVGAILRGNVVILDDVITAGTAIKESMSYINANNARLAAVLVAFDREEKGQGNLSVRDEILLNYNATVHSIISLTDLINYLESSSEHAVNLQRIYSYREQYGNKNKC